MSVCGIGTVMPWRVQRSGCMARVALAVGVWLFRCRAALPPRVLLVLGLHFWSAVFGRLFGWVALLVTPRTSSPPRELRAAGAIE
jgi:hypothetical protein